MEENPKAPRALFVAAYFVPLFLLFLLTLLLPGRKLSENENRSLAQMPEFRLQDLGSGSYQASFTQFLSDQVPLREFWIRSNTALRKLSGQKELNGVYLGKDHYYFQKFTEESYSATRMTAVFRQMEAFLEAQSVPAAVMLVPSPGTVLAEKLPAQGPYYDADPVFEAAKQILSCSVIDLRTCFSDAAETTQLYYRTDHHWTSQGAYLAYREYCRALGLTPREYRLEPVAEDFYGTLYSKVLDGGAVPDRIYAPVGLPKVTVTYEDGTVTDTLYHREKLAQKDKYAYFLGGNYGMVTLWTQGDPAKKLLILKDSFCNSFVPYLLEDYGEILMIDLRYFDGNLSEVIRRQGTTQILFLYETTNFLTDKGILKLRKL